MIVLFPCCRGMRFSFPLDFEKSGSSAKMRTGVIDKEGGEGRSGGRERERRGRKRERQGGEGGKGGGGEKGDTSN